MLVLFVRGNLIEVADQVLHTLGLMWLNSSNNN